MRSEGTTKENRSRLSLLWTPRKSTTRVVRHHHGEVTAEDAPSRPTVTVTRERASSQRGAEHLPLMYTPETVQLVPMFDALTYPYRAEVLYGVTSPKVKYELRDTNAKNGRFASSAPTRATSTILAWCRTRPRLWTCRRVRTRSTVARHRRGRHREQAANNLIKRVKRAAFASNDNYEWRALSLDPGKPTGPSTLLTRDLFSKMPGIWSDGDTLWVTGDDADNAKGFAFELPKGCNSCRKSSLDFELSGDNDNPWGITGNDDTWWVTEVGEDGFTTDTRTVYAYNRSDGTRDTDKDIDLSELTTTHLQQLYYGLAATESCTSRSTRPGPFVQYARCVRSSSAVTEPSDATLSSLSLTDVHPMWQHRLTPGRRYTMGVLPMM